MIETDLTTIHLSTNHQTLTYTNSFYYNWLKALQANLMQTNNFMNQFVQLKKDAPESYDKVQQRLLFASVIAFLKQLEPSDSLILLTTSWSSGLSAKQPEKTLQNYLSRYTIQENDLHGINQMIADLNQVLIQHFPLVRKQDLKMIYRLLEIYPLPKETRNEQLSKLNQRAKERTTELLSLLEDAFSLANNDKETLNDPSFAKYV